MAALALVDSSATRIFLHLQFAQECGAVVSPRKYLHKVRVIDGRMINSGLITHEANVQLVIGDHCKILVADITNTGKYSCILGTPWLVCNDPTIRWSCRDVQFDSSFCQEQCIQQRMVSGGTCKLKWMPGLVASKHAMVVAMAFQLLAKDAEIYTLEICECNEPELVSIPHKYHDLSKAFSENASNELPDRGPFDIKIDFKEGQEPRDTGLRPISPMELEELQKYLKENLGKECIRQSKSPISVPIVFAKKKDGSIMVCVVYRNLNRVTVKNCYPLPLILEILIGW